MERLASFALGLLVGFIIYKITSAIVNAWLLAA